MSLNKRRDEGNPMQQRHHILVGWLSASLVLLSHGGLAQQVAPDVARQAALPAAETAPVQAAALLADAVEAQDRERCDALLLQGADMNHAQPDGMTALHWATYHDDFACTQRLLTAGAQAHIGNTFGVYPLTLACQNGNHAIIELLLAAGADVNTTLPGGESALMIAARTGRPGAVQALLEHGAQVDAHERHGQTALMWAAAEGHLETVELLLDAGADYRTALPSGFTPLFFAVREGRIAVVERLLRAGIDVNHVMTVERAGGASPRSGTSALILAVENGHFDLALSLLTHGSDPNDQRSGFTALHALTWVRKPNRGDGLDGNPPPAGSGQLDSLDLARELVVRFKADVNAQLQRGASGRGQLNRAGATPLLLAARTADLPYLRRLLELGADPHRTNVDESTPLMAAAGLGTLAPGEEAGSEPEALEAVRMLLDLGANVNAVDRNGETAMHGAAYKNLPGVVALLAARGARVEVWNQANRYGWTPIAIATGHRPGNFKPSPDTLAALEEARQ